MSNPEGLKMLDKVGGIEDVKEEPTEKKKPSYIFPNFLGEFMSKIDLRVQLEASMLSMALMMVGLIVTITYIFVYIDFQLWYKIFLVFNGFAGILFMSSNLVTTFNQYRSYMEVVEYQKEQKEEASNVDKEEEDEEKKDKDNNKKENKLNKE